MRLIRYLLWEWRRICIRRSGSWVDVSASIDDQSNLIGFNKIYSRAALIKSTIGRYSYVSTGTRIINSSIGSFCSIGPNVLIGLGMHPINSFSTHPVFYSNRGQTTKSFTSENKFEELKPVHVGNDVWIGASAVVMDGVTISDGAIIAAGAIVTKDVRPYAIVAGVPAKEVRRRFDDNKIEELLEWKWWNLSERQLHILAENFRSDGLWTVAALNEAVESK